MRENGTEGRVTKDDVHEFKIQRPRDVLIHAETDGRIHLVKRTYWCSRDQAASESLRDLGLEGAKRGYNVLLQPCERRERTKAWK